MGDRIGPREVTAAARGATRVLGAAAGPSETVGSRAEWVEALEALQALVDTAQAAQDVATVRLAAIEPETLESGEEIETHRAPGHVALDAPALVSGALVVTQVEAERRVRAAVRLAADGPEGTDTATGLAGLHLAMASGRLDPYRAGVVATELEECPAEVAATVVTGLEEYLGVEDGPRLRRRVRRMLARISPDLLRQRAVRARSESRLERWAGEPGVDTWHGTFPSEEALVAWAAIDDLAQRYVADGTCSRVDRARAKALTDLVTGAATVDVDVRLTVPAEAGASPGACPADAASDLVEVGGARPAEPMLVPRGWLGSPAHGAGSCADAPPASRGEGGGPPRGIRDPESSKNLVCDPGSGGVVDPRDDLRSSGYRLGRRLARLVRDRDGRCRFPGCHVAARFCDLDHVLPWPAGVTSAANLVCLCRRHHRVKQRPGWRVVLAPDGTARWTDPTGRTRMTAPLDRLDPVVLPDLGTDPASEAGAPDGGGDLFSPVEYALEHLLVPSRQGPRRSRAAPAAPGDGCRVDVHVLRGPSRLVDLPRHRPRAGRPPPRPDVPPF
ncbi:HNH endonuclease [Phycicoccus sp. BSK3Z-2]|uniref:HNH endonuclease n=1 Tax=Phycicoccus avicenniae TaxID=2828860 RepID=A0A941D740_9MICO|nr:HNH endonuclease signature motif containing protein [Phycicoccus avicenniae]MBR7743324.1 HNH endonuclease [Phycicoccus avicenniae]